MVETSYFSDDLFKFLRNLKRHNNREWFEKHRADYEAFAKNPMLSLLQDLKPRFEKIAPHFVCDPKPNGGSMFRIYRDMRFVDPDEGPFKLHVSAQLRHRRGKDVHAPGFYLHLEPGSCFFAGGLWRPPTSVRNQVHQAIANNPKKWLQIKSAKSFSPLLSNEGEMLKKPSAAWRDTLPPQIMDDLRRKDFIFSVDLDQATVTSKNLTKEILNMTKRTIKFMEFLSGGQI